MIVATSPKLKVTINHTCVSGLKVVNQYVFMNFTVDDITPTTTKLTSKIDDFFTAINYKPGCLLEGAALWRDQKDVENFLDADGVSWVKYKFDSLNLNILTDATQFNFYDKDYFELMTAGNGEGYQKNVTLGFYDRGLDPATNQVDVTVVATICGHNNVFQFNHSMCAGYY